MFLSACKKVIFGDIVETLQTCYFGEFTCTSPPFMDEVLSEEKVKKDN